MKGKRFRASILALLLLSLAMTLVACGGETAVKTATLEEPQLDSGAISGTREGDIWVYKGIPYAAPPVGDLRWREPQPVEPWEGVLACEDFGPACPQPASDDWGGFLTIGETDEDCLYLNVWTPAGTPDESLPVMFWIHGGAYRTGAGSQVIYDGVDLAEEGVVVVTVNYRLGPFGFLAHPLLSEESPHGSSGNYGLLDQIAALDWVQRNISSFGGDPDNVTVFGESAGGMSIYSLMSSPLAEGLFDRAIIQSGPFLDMGLPLNPENSLENAERKGERVSRDLGCSREVDELACLRGKTPEEIMEAADRGDDPLDYIRLEPNVDGYVLPASPSAVFAAGEQHDVPLMVGSNADDGSIFVPDANLQQTQLFLGVLYGEHADRVEAQYPVETEEEVWAVISQVITEMGFAVSARLCAEAMQAKESPGYLYLFSRIPDDPRAEGLGAFHGLEIIYIFNSFDKVGIEGVDQVDRDLSRMMMDYWVNFAKTGDPNGPGVPDWPVYTSQLGEFQELGDEVVTRSGFYDEAWELTKEISGKR